MRDILFYLKPIIYLLLIAHCWSLHIGPVYAQQQGLSLLPPANELAIKPGGTINIRYRIANHGDPTIVKFRVAGKDINTVSPISFQILNSELKLEEEIFLKNSSQLDILLNVGIPEGIPEQDYYFDFIAETQPPPPEEGKASLRAKITLKSPLLIIVTSTGQVEIKPKISIFDMVPNRKIRFLGFELNIFDSFATIPAVLVVENKGKNLFKPRGEIIVRGPLWNTRIYSIEPQTVLAGSQKRITVDLDRAFIGSFKVSANLNFGEGTPTIYATGSFLTLPLKTLFFLVPIIALILLARSKKKGIN